MFAYVCYSVLFNISLPAILIPVTQTLSAFALSMAVLQNTPRQTGDLCVNFGLNCPQIDSAERGGSNSSGSSSPQRKHAMNTEGGSPTGTNVSMALGGRGARTTPKVSEKPPTLQKGNQGAKTQTKQTNPKGKPTKAMQPQRECKWAKPLNQKVARTNNKPTSTSQGWTRDQRISFTRSNKACTASMSHA